MNDKDYADIDEDTLYTMSVTLGKPKLWEMREKYLKKEGENLLAALIKKLISAGREKNISRVTTDVKYRELLYIQFGLKKSV
jgi:hypothetical protein